MKKIDYSDIEPIRSYIEQFGYNEYNCNIVTLLMWKDVYELYYEIHDHFFVGYWSYHDRIRWMMPLCKEEHLKEAVDYMMDYSKQQNLDFVIEAAIEEFINKLRKVYSYDHFICRLEENTGDYVYDLSMHASLQGKKMQKRRNHYNAFIKEYNDRFIFKPYVESMKTDVLNFLHQWKESHEHKEDIEAEINGITKMLEHYQELHLMGGCIYIDGHLEAFTLASVLQHDTLQIHVEKANRDIRGLYVAILKYFLNDHLKYTYINREDDLGIPELRKAKMDLHPLYRLNKYAIGLNDTKIIQPTAKYQEAIKQLWLSSFADEDENSTEFYFNHLYEERYTYSIICHDHILAALQIKPMTINVAGESLEAYFIVGVCTQYKFKGNGFMHALMNKALNDHQEAPLILLQAYNWDIYKSFGFEITYYQNKYSIKEQFIIVNKIVYNCSIEAPTSDLLASYQNFVQHYQGYRQRDEAYYNDYFIPYHNNEGHSIVTVYSQQNCIGYLVINSEEEKISIIENTISDIVILKQVLNDLLKDVNCIELSTASNMDLGIDKQVIANMAIRYQDRELKELMKYDNLFINETL